MHLPNKKFFSAVILLSALAIPTAPAQSRRQRPSGADPSFSYYLLALSYAPDFCAQPSGKKDARECGAGRQIGFVVHGLWPQGDRGRGPENCRPSSPVGQEIVRATLRYIPTESLIQHEWTTHGSCSGLSAADYFKLVRDARDMVKIPDDLKAPSKQLQLSPTAIEAKLAAANPDFPKTAFRVSCYRSGELEEIRVCLNKNLSPRGCGGASTCAAGTVQIRPVR